MRLLCKSVLQPSTQHITHVYNTGDPVPMGVCTGVSSTCAVGGYAMESKCHLGNVILYDTVTKHKWSVGIGNHAIRTIIDLLSEDFDPENGISVPVAEPQKDCVVSLHVRSFSCLATDCISVGLFRLGVWEFQVNPNPRASGLHPPLEHYNPDIRYF